MDESIVMFTRARAAEVSGLSERRIAYWAQTNLVGPSIDRRLTANRPVRLYSYRDLMTVLIIAELRGHRISLQHIRQIVHHIESRDFQMTELPFAIAGKRVHFRAPDGMWENAVDDQIVLHQVLDLKPLHARLRRSGRNPETVGKVEKRRGTLGSKPVLAGTRVPVAAVRRFLDRGASTDEILEAYPALQPADVEAARQAVSA